MRTIPTLAAKSAIAAFTASAVQARPADRATTRAASRFEPVPAS